MTERNEELEKALDSFAESAADVAYYKDKGMHPHYDRKKKRALDDMTADRQRIRDVFEKYNANNLTWEPLGGQTDG